MGSSAEVYDLLSFKEHEERLSAKSAYAVLLKISAPIANEDREKERGREGEGGSDYVRCEEKGEETKDGGRGEGEGSPGLEDRGLCMMRSSISGSRSSFSTGHSHPHLSHTCYHIGSSRDPDISLPYNNFADGCPKGLLSSICFQQLQLDRRRDNAMGREREKERERESTDIRGGESIQAMAGRSGVDGRMNRNKDIKRGADTDWDRDRDNKNKKEMEREIERSTAIEVDRSKSDMSRQKDNRSVLAGAGAGAGAGVNRDRGGGRGQGQGQATPTSTSIPVVEDGIAVAMQVNDSDVPKEIDNEKEKEKETGEVRGKVYRSLSSPSTATTTATTTATSAAEYLTNSRARQSEKEKDAEADDRSGWRRDKETLFPVRKDESMQASSSSLYEKRILKAEEGRSLENRIIMDRNGHVGQVEKEKEEEKEEVKEKTRGDRIEEDRRSAYLLHLRTMRQRPSSKDQKDEEGAGNVNGNGHQMSFSSSTSHIRDSLLLPQGSVHLPPNLYGSPSRASLLCEPSIFTTAHNDDPGGTIERDTPLRESVPSKNRVSSRSYGGILDPNSLNSTTNSHYYNMSSPPPSPPTSPPRPSPSLSPSPSSCSPSRSHLCGNKQKSTGEVRNPFADLLDKEQGQGQQQGYGVRVRPGSVTCASSSSSSSSFSTGTSPSPADRDRDKKRRTTVQRKNSSYSPPPPASASASVHTSPHYSLRFSSPSNRQFSPPPSRILLPSFPSSNPSYYSSPSNRSQETVAGGEKGWITSHTNKGYTHNVPLNHACAHAIATRMVCHIKPFFLSSFLLSFLPYPLFPFCYSSRTSSSHFFSLQPTPYHNICNKKHGYQFMGK